MKADLGIMFADMPRLLQRMIIRELLYLRSGGHSITPLVVYPMIDLGLITKDTPQPFSNSSYSGTAVTLTEKGEKCKLPEKFRLTLEKIGV